MNDATDPQPNRRPDAWHAPDDLTFLVSHPSLTGFAGRGRDFDRLPVTTTAWAFVAATASSLLTLGYLGAVVVAIGTVVGVGLVASALVNRDVKAARAVLRTTAAGLVGWVLMIALVVHPSTI